MPEIVKAIEDDQTLGDDMSDEKKEELLSALREHRSLKTNSVRVDNRAANHDYQHTVSQMNQEVSWHVPMDTHLTHHPLDELNVSSDWSYWFRIVHKGSYQ